MLRKVPELDFSNSNSLLISDLVRTPALLVCLLAILVGMLVITGPSSSPSSGWKLLTMASGFLTFANNSTASLLVRSPLSKKG